MASSPAPLAPSAFRRRSLRVQLSIGLAAAMILPLLVMYLWSRAFVDRVRRDAEHDLYDATRSASRVVDGHVAEHLRAIRLLAPRLGLRPLNAGTVAGPLAGTLALYPGFHGILVADTAGRIVLLDQPSDAAEAAAFAGRSVRDRPYFTEPMATGREHLSEVYRGRGPARAMVVTVSAPVEDAAGRRVGVVAGSLDLAGFARLEREYAFLAPAARVVVTDGHGHVVYGGRDRRFEPLEDLAATPLVRLGATEGPVYEWRDSTAAGTVDQLVGHAQGEQGWHVYVALPTGQVWSEVRLFQASLLGAAILAVAVLALALWLVTRQALQPLEQLVVALRQFSVVEPQKELPLPREAPAEIAELVDSFELMSQRVGTVLSGILPICASCKRIRNHMGGWENVETYVRDRSEAEFSHTVCPDCHTRLYPEGSL